jgi:hypothetical protein
MTKSPAGPPAGFFMRDACVWIDRRHSVEGKFRPSPRPDALQIML